MGTQIGMQFADKAPCLQVKSNCKPSQFAYPPPVTEEASVAVSKVCSSSIHATYRARRHVQRRNFWQFIFCGSSAHPPGTLHTTTPVQAPMTPLAAVGPHKHPGSEPAGAQVPTAVLSTTARAKERAKKREDMKARASGVEDSTPRAQDAAKAAAAAAAAAPSGE